MHDRTIAVSIVHGIQVCWLGLRGAGESCRAELSQTVCRASTFRIVPLAYLFVGQYVSRPDSCRAELTETVCRVSACRKVSLGCLLSVSMYLDRSVVSRRARVFCGPIPSQSGRIQSTENSGRNHCRWYKSKQSDRSKVPKFAKVSLGHLFLAPTRPLRSPSGLQGNFLRVFVCFTMRFLRPLGDLRGPWESKMGSKRVSFEFLCISPFWLNFGSIWAPFWLHFDNPESRGKKRRKRGGPPKCCGLHLGMFLAPKLILDAVLF